ncbi:MAG: hypothetical protein V3T17_03890 [Pseudomonadales bacterium]
MDKRVKSRVKELKTCLLMIAGFGIKGADTNGTDLRAALLRLVTVVSRRHPR